MTAGMTSTGVALSSSMAGAATGTISRGVLGNAVLGEKNSPMKIANDTLRNTTFAAGTTAVGIGVNNLINGNSSTYQYGDITRNASYVNPYGTGANDITDDIANYLSDVSANRIGQEMASATANSAVGGCVKAPVDYGNSNTQITTYYPPRNGAILGTEKYIQLETGTIIDRYGTNSGNYFAPVDTPIYQRALPYGTDLAKYHKYEVIKPFVVESSTIAPAFGQLGGGTQYHSFSKASTLIEGGYIKEIIGN